MARVMTLGTFDIPHLGHKAFLEKAASFADHRAGDEFIIGVNSDRFVKQFKGEAPLYNQYERKQFIESLGYRKVEFNDGPGKALIERWRPRLLVVGSDWLERGGYLAQIGMTQATMRESDLTIIFVPYTPGISTSDIKRRMNERA